MDKKQRLIVYILLAVMIAGAVFLLIIRGRNRIASESRVLVYFVGYNQEKQESYLAPLQRELGKISGLEDKIRFGIEQLFKGLTEEEKTRVAKVAVKLLGHPDNIVVFEAAFLLKELKMPCSYPHVINKLKETPTCMSLETRRMLRATAESIALEVTGELFTMTGNYRKGDWNRQVFERMKKHNEMLRGLEKPIRQKALLKK